MNHLGLKNAASLTSDLTLVVEIIMGLALIAGMVLARRGRYRAHARCQSAVVLLNLIPITLTMATSFWRSFAPPLPAGLHNSYYRLPAVHALLGVVAEMFGLYVLAVAGTKIIPKRIQFSRYRVWMRTALAMWWLVLILGGVTYLRWYVAPLRMR